jgi:RNA polymerase sigma-70 factor (ECF subfamily)
VIDPPSPSDPRTTREVAEGMFASEAVVAAARPVQSTERDRTYRRAVEPIVPVVWRVLRRCGVPEAEVDDAVQRVLLQLARQWERLGGLPAGELRSYACCAAAGLAKSVARERARRVRAAAAEMGPPSVAAAPDEALHRKQSVAQLDAILEAMDEERRTVFVLYEIEGLSGPEIAEHLGIPLGTVASRLRKGRDEFNAAVARLRAGVR